MGIYSPGRRRAIVLLLLTSILLVTIDLRGNELFDAARRGFNTVLGPFETAGEVITRPLQNAWHGITDYEDLAEENRRLQDQLDAQTADVVAGRAAIADNQELSQLLDLPALADYDIAVAQVVGEGPTNIDQVIEINKGSADGLEIGMPVISPAGLVGKVTAPLEAHRARIMLITDSRYTISVKIIPGTPPTTTTSTVAPPSTTLAPTGPVGPGETTPPASATTTTTPATTTTSSVPGAAPDPATTTTVVATTTTLDLDVARETGSLQGQGEGELPAVIYLDSTPTLGRFEIGDLVFTSGSEDSLAPPNVPIGRIVNVIERTTSEGPLLEVELLADIDALSFVSVILFEPQSEAGGDPSDADGAGD